MLGSELLTSNSKFPGRLLGFARDLPDQLRSDSTVRGYRGRWINVRDVREGGVDQTVVLFELLILVFFVLIHRRECGRSLRSVHGIDKLV